jgi:AraC-like DNA-binding protein
MLLWCKAGRGSIRVNTETIPMSPNDFVFLPWGRSMVYQAEEKEPFFVGGIHIIPFHDRHHKVVYEVAHREGDPFWRSTWRKDVTIPTLAGIKRGSLTEATALRHLGEYTIQRFSAGRRQEWESRSLAQLLLSALSDFFNPETTISSALPLPLLRMMQFVRNHPHRKLSLVDIARFAERSPSAVGRLFQRHLRMTTVTFIARTKMEFAQQLLSTSVLPVSEVGRRVGIEDPYYFSKLFRKTVGVSPLEHRKKSSLL